MSTVCCLVCWPCVHESDAAIVENCGKFDKILVPGCHCIMWPCSIVVNVMSLRVQYIEIPCDTKTKDNVFVSILVAVQYKIVEEKVSSAFYKLSDPRAQIRSYVFDVVRSTIPGLLIDDAFASKNTLAESIRERLSELMSDFGYKICDALVVDISPDGSVKAAMNEINASQRMREAAAEKAEAEKILQVKGAEADAESKYLSGVGVARQRKAIVEGLQTTVLEFSSQVPGTTSKDVMDLLLVTQYFDLLRDLGKKDRGSTIFLPHGPDSVNTLRHHLKDSFAAGFGNS